MQIFYLKVAHFKNICHVSPQVKQECRKEQIEVYALKLNLLNSFELKCFDDILLQYAH